MGLIDLLTNKEIRKTLNTNAVHLQSPRMVSLICRKKVGLLKVAPRAKRKRETVRLSGMSGRQTMGMEEPKAHPLHKKLLMLDLHLNVHTVFSGTLASKCADVEGVWMGTEE